MRNQACTIKNPDNPAGDGWKTLPVESVTWYDTLVFCNRLSIREKLKPVYSIDNSIDPDDWGEPPNRSSPTKWDAVKMDTAANGYRLPTEAEWEYACRAGTTTLFNTGNTITTDQANYFDPNPKATVSIRSVGSYAPNAWGLYDMHGNVSEWCWDWYGPYSNGSQTNPVGAFSGRYRVIRGGNLALGALDLRSACRKNAPPTILASVVSVLCAMHSEQFQRTNSKEQVAKLKLGFFSSSFALL